MVHSKRTKRKKADVQTGESGDTALAVMKCWLHRVAETSPRSRHDVWQRIADCVRGSHTCASVVSLNFIHDVMKTDEHWTLRQWLVIVRTLTNKHSQVMTITFGLLSMVASVKVRLWNCGPASFVSASSVISYIKIWCNVSEIQYWLQRFVNWFWHFSFTWCALLFVTSALQCGFAD